MRYRRLGRTGLNVSEVSLGTVEIGLDYGLTDRPDESEVARLLHRALDLGINFLDTARLYGESEALIGRILGNRRSDFLICSKVSAGSEPEMRKSVETSLRALNRDSLDMLMIHSAATDVIGEGEALGVLQKLRREGKVAWIGASVYGEAAALAAIQTGEFDCLQVACSALDRRNEHSVWAEAQVADIGIVGRSLLLRGALTDRYPQLPDSLADLKRAVPRDSRYRRTSRTEFAGVSVSLRAWTELAANRARRRLIHAGSRGCRRVRRTRPTARTTWLSKFGTSLLPTNGT